MAPFSRNQDLGRLSRREWLTLAAAGVSMGSSSGWLQTLAADAARNPQRKRACILLWMSGGPSQMDTFDLKPGHANGGPYKPIATATPGIQISEHLPQIAKHMDRMVLVRSMSTKEGDHGRATFLLRTGYLPQGPISYPPLGALVAHQLAGEELDLPSFVSVSPARFLSPAAFTSGFLGPQYAPLVVGEGGIPGANANTNYSEALKVQDLAPPAGITQAQENARLEILRNLESDFVRERPIGPALGHQTAYERAVRLMRSPAAKAFNLEEEPDALRDAYGRSGFGQGCMLARRLVERGVPFVEVTLNGVDGDALGWDTHASNFDRVKRLSGILDPAFGTLMTDLKQRGLLDSTTIVWMGEFGRTPKINPAKGRDHFPNAWSTVIAGGGLKGGQVVGKTSADGMSVEERVVSVPDFLATVCLALGIDFKKQNNSNVGRPIRIVDKAAKPINEVIA
ncbi:MAG TPA: DUF1501 domain-containing protein [Gemmataceae bacterium]|jgi:uncharacterized protein (DUF1501 family)|nr:DUF1501 domain-containing protein [Gemmataceae bacterium]